ncbi:MAG TPA: hypothetical protein VNG71_01450 [Pyrinomonadaceae bacterium]|nr:hypothetical protein [Pyrinomonadaceae bacterium]
MRNPNRFAIAIALVGAIALSVIAQRPRSTTQDSTDSASSMPAPPTAPATVKAKYEGGVFGHNKHIDGTLNFDDANERLVFRDGKGKETGIFLPYKSLTGAYGDTHKVRPAAATVASNIPTIFALPAHFIKTKVRYLTLQYDDPDSRVSGVTSFKLENKDILDSVLFTLANKAGLDRRGEVFVRKRQPANP